MTPTSFDSDAFKKVLKEALSETLREERELLHDVFAEVLEVVALAEAIREGLQTDRIERNAVFDILEGKA